MGQQMKRVCIIILSVLLVYAGAAWSLGKCPEHTGDMGHNHEIKGKVHAFDNTSFHPATHNGPETKFECLHSYYGVELTLPARAGTQLLRLSETVFLLGAPAETSIGQDSPILRLQAGLILGVSPPFPYHSNLLRYLLLSVFLI